MDQSYPTSIRVGDECFKVPSVQDCLEFNRAADEWLMARGVKPKSFGDFDFSNKKNYSPQEDIPQSVDEDGDME